MYLKKSCTELESSIKALPELEQANDEEFGHTVGSNLPAEMWIKIFEFAKPQQPKHLSKLRLVCKRWRDVIDENFDLKVRIHDDTMDASTIQRFRKVSHCIVSKFVREIPQQQLLMNPNLLKQLTIRGPISRQNFSLIANHCDAVTDFIFTESILVKEANIFNAAKIERFTNSLKKLVFTGIWIELDPGTRTAENIFQLLKCPMPNLTSLTIRASYIKAFDEQQFVSFVCRCLALETLELTLRPYGKPNNAGLPLTPFTTVPILKTVKIECYQNALFQQWIPLLMAQTSMKCLNLLLSDSKRDDFQVDSQIKQILLKNQLSLEYLELGEITKESSIDGGFFQGMLNLKVLKLKGASRPMAKIQNFRLLPQSIETLELINVKSVM